MSIDDLDRIDDPRYDPSPPAEPAPSNCAKEHYEYLDAQDQAVAVRQEAASARQNLQTALHDRKTLNDAVQPGLEIFEAVTHHQPRGKKEHDAFHAVVKQIEEQRLAVPSAASKDDHAACAATLCKVIAAGEVAQKEGVPANVGDSRYSLPQALAIGRDAAENAENAKLAKEVPALQAAVAQADARIAEAEQAIADARTRLKEALKQAAGI
ncbi:hypothetical protein [Streptomyces halobius]|uniref:Uncharacterized protein n=1 Tax=Streptomyces halobius TaxID=2879846 RepID=A0ABY4M3F9_9ACTN|nr:hypothetical protein [Streptomyces halobius]UQA91394.1 hypothetical protein K9S39_05420 [Streptomyces halobius]